MDPLLIQRPPTGLLDLLGLKAMGQGPILLNETVTATLADCVDYYVANRRSTVAGSTGVAMVANTSYPVAACTVPAGEIWLVYAAAATLLAATAAGTAIRFWLSLGRTSSAFPVAITETVSVGASDNGTAVVVNQRPAVWLPGDVATIQTGAVTGVPGANGRVVMDVARLTL